MQHYHYIFTGSGLAAMMTVYEMIRSEKFKDKSILLLDENPKKSNDRTWCFWEKSSQFDDLVFKNWEVALFANHEFQKDLHLFPYRYKMVKGSYFYQMFFHQISHHPNIHFINEKVDAFQETGNHCIVKTPTQSFSCNKIFNSIFRPDLVNNQTKYPLLHQHFVGWFVQTNESVFDVNKVTFMDFSVAQQGNTRFMYILPTSANQALVEYTLFSKDLLSKKEYEDEIEKYLKTLGVSQYKILDKEQGNIPMSCYPFWKHNSKNIINIGSAGGWTKASTGYTFKNTTKKAKALVSFLVKENDFRKFHKKDKFWFYDLLFIDVLYRRNDLGFSVFSALFKKGDSRLIFKFLDEETSFLEDLRVIWKCPKGLFLKALWNRFIMKKTASL